MCQLNEHLIMVLGIKEWSQLFLQYGDLCLLLNTDLPSIEKLLYSGDFCLDICSLALSMF
jgi:hypothetical protein